MRKAEAARLSIYSNSVLIGLKLIVGVSMMSVSGLSEAIHSMIDLVASLMANYSIRKAIQPRMRITTTVMASMRTWPG